MVPEGTSSGSSPIWRKQLETEKSSLQRQYPFSPEIRFTEHLLTQNVQLLITLFPSSTLRSRKEALPFTSLRSKPSSNVVLIELYFMRYFPWISHSSSVVASASKSISIVLAMRNFAKLTPFTILVYLGKLRIFFVKKSSEIRARESPQYQVRILFIEFRITERNRLIP